MLRLLGKASSINVRKVLWSAELLGLPLVREDWGSGFRATDDPVFLALNPNGLVPVLVDGDTVLWESNTICRYLAAREGRTDLLGATPRERAVVEQWMDRQIAELNPAWRYAFMMLVRHSPAHRDATALAAGVQGWNRLMALLDGRLERTGAYVAGAGFTLADVVLGLSMQRWCSTPIDRPGLPALAAWFGRLAAQPGFDRHVANGLP